MAHSEVICVAGSVGGGASAIVAFLNHDAVQPLDTAWLAFVAGERRREVSAVKSTLRFTNQTD